MRLKRLTLTNFMQFKEKVFDFSETSDTMVIGRNESGKSTIETAHSWVITGKDAKGQNELNFGIKTMVDDKVIHGLDHSVEGVYIFDDGTEITLKRIYKEKWTAKRGSVTKRLTGHETEYYINDVPQSKGEYDAKISKYIADEQTFRICSMTHYFGDVLDTKTRRSIVMGMVNTVEDVDIAKRAGLEGLVMMLDSGMTMNDIEVQANQRMKQYNDRLKDIPIRIDEANNSICESEMTVAEVEALVDSLKIDLKGVEDKKTLLMSGSTVDLKEKLAKSKFRKSNKVFDSAPRKKIEEAISQKRMILNEHNYKLKLYNVDGLKDELKMAEEKLKEYQASYDLLVDEKFVSDVEDTCPTCNQPLPSDQVIEAIKVAEAKFNVEKAEKLKLISEKGKLSKKKVSDFKGKIANASQELTNLNKEIETIKSEIKKLDEECSAKLAAENDLQDEHLKACDNEIAEIEKQIANVESGLAADVEPLDEQINGLTHEIDRLKDEKALINSNQKATQRIEDLKAEMIQASSNYEDNQQIIQDVEDFKRAKSEYITSDVNKLFKVARFKLFEDQVNGGLKDICDIVGNNGVGWHQAMNNGQKVNIGIDLAHTFGKYYNLDLPIFIDNAESVTEFQPVDNQVIYLVHSAEHKDLTIESI